MKFSRIVKRNKADIAFIVGNGINRFNSNGSGNSWDELLIELWNRYSSSEKSVVPKGIALTEFFDVLELRQSQKSASNSLQKEFCDLMESWSPSDHHRKFVEWAINNQSPILTTNFENTLGDAASCKLYRMSGRKFTDFYPWESYYSNREIDNLVENFGIWHINGMQRYHRSISLGLTHYMGSVERARNWIHKGDERRLFSGKNQRNWLGANTWLHIIFNKPIAIFGLALDQTEVFLRWLLIERAKYFSKFPERHKEAWYVYKGNRPDSGKIMFFKNLGITAVQADKYEELYKDPWRSS